MGIGVGALLLAAAGVVIYLLMKRRRRDNPQSKEVGYVNKLSSSDDAQPHYANAELPPQDHYEANKRYLRSEADGSMIGQTYSQQERFEMDGLPQIRNELPGDNNK